MQLIQGLRSALSLENSMLLLFSGGLERKREALPAFGVKMKTSAGTPMLCFPRILSLSHISTVIMFLFQARNMILFLLPFQSHFNEFSSHTRARIVLDGNNNWTTGKYWLWVADRQGT